MPDDVGVNYTGDPDDGPYHVRDALSSIAASLQDINGEPTVGMAIVSIAIDLNRIANHITGETISMEERIA